MSTAFISHPACLNHDTGPYHPERPERIRAIEDYLQQTGLIQKLQCLPAQRISPQSLQLVHPESYLNQLRANLPEEGYYSLDPDTCLSPHSLLAAEYAAGAVVTAVDRVMDKTVNNAFCCVRPPGHHAESSRAMGFCIFNNIAIASAYAMAHYDISRVAIVDFDVHQGNGTEQIVKHNKQILFCSTFQFPLYPFTEIVRDNPLNVSIPLTAGDASTAFRSAVEQHWLPALITFRPQMIMISAGFDAHKDDPISETLLTDEDYRWVTQQIGDIAQQFSAGRIVSSLEGGYELDSLARSVAEHIEVLLSYTA